MVVPTLKHLLYLMMVMSGHGVMVILENLVVVVAKDVQHQLSSRNFPVRVYVRCYVVHNSPSLSLHKAKFGLGIFLIFFFIYLFLISVLLSRAATKKIGVCHICGTLENCALFIYFLSLIV